MALEGLFREPRHRVPGFGDLAFERTPGKCRAAAHQSREDEEKQEEKFDFTADGEALGYISLAQARLLAMQTARETPGNYVTQYDNVPMVFAVTESGQEEDYYTVILSFRPEVGFTGTSGPQQFVISNE